MYKASQRYIRGGNANNIRLVKENKFNLQLNLKPKVQYKENSPDLMLENENTVNPLTGTSLVYFAYGHFHKQNTNQHAEVCRVENIT